MATYKEMMDQAFGAYYERFRALHATSAENAVTKDELFPQGESRRDAEAMHKMLSMEVVKRVDRNRYWLDEARAADGKAVLKQRILIIVLALILGLTIGILKRMGILNF